MNWDIVVLSLIYFRTASILFDLKNLNLSKHFETCFERLTGIVCPLLNNLGTLRIYDGDGEDDAFSKNVSLFYFGIFHLLRSIQCVCRY